MMIEMSAGGVDPDSGIPMIYISPMMAFCAKHLEPFRLSWPVGVPQALAGITNAALEDAALREFIDGDAQRVQHALQSCAPICCFLEEEKTQQVISLALNGSTYGEAP